MRRDFSAFFAGSSVLAATAVGCAAPIGPESDAGSTARHALVEVRAVHAANDGSMSRLDASARFVSVREPGMPSDALDLLGLAWPAVQSGTCTLATAANEPARPTSSFRVDLRDLSPVSLDLKTDDGVVFPLNLEPRAFPDVVGLVSGVVFVGPSELPTAAAAGKDPRFVALSVSGGAPFEFELPDVPAPVRLHDAVAGDVTGTFTIDGAGSGVELSTPAAHGDDRVVVDVLRAGFVRARCGVDGSGRLRVDGTTLGGIGDVTLLVRAQRRIVRDDLALGAVEARLERDVEVKLQVK